MSTESWLCLNPLNFRCQLLAQSVPSLPDEPNDFYARFEASNTEVCMRAPAVLDDCVITLSLADVSKTFKQVNIDKAAGPDGLQGSVL